MHGHQEYGGISLTAGNEVLPKPLHEKRRNNAGGFGVHVHISSMWKTAPKFLILIHSFQN
jgi:hypothetical protein